ncbi:MAG TPA: hypothetical protein VKH37_07300, partial [Ferruginibacter sp.]|nr:hypothetical protein [Ferruginibacter sp.]
VTGDKIALTANDISSTGGDISINKPGDPLDKLNINIPANAYGNTQHFDISYEPIKSNNIGPYFNPLTPLITITNGGGYANELMTLTIPVHVPEGKFAMAFLYDKQTGELEGMPLIASEKDKVVVVTRTFDFNSGANNETARRSPGSEMKLGGGNEGSAQIVVSATDEKDLKKDFDSRFRPGVDDCPMPNPGSTYSPKGICSGESVAALWYYNEKKLNGAPALNKLLDNDGGRRTPKFWQDDTKGVRLASILQYDFSYSMPLRVLTNLGQLISQSILPNRMTMHALACAMIVTHKPQYIAMVDNNFNGHAMICYRIYGDDVYIADPNLPGDTTRTIRYDPDTHQFGSYTTGVMNKDKLISTETYTHVWYIAKASLQAYPTVERNWKAVENGSIGNNKFPAYSLVALNENDEFVPFEDGFNVPNGTLNVNVHGNGVKLASFLYDASGNLLVIDANTPAQLPEGEQQVGVYVT